MGDGLGPGSVGSLIAQITEVLAQERVTPTHERKHTLELAAAGQDRRGRLVRKRDGKRNIAARPAQHDGRPARDSRDGIIAARFNRAVVDQEHVSDAAEPLSSVIIF